MTHNTHLATGSTVILKIGTKFKSMHTLYRGIFTEAYQPNHETESPPTLQVLFLKLFRQAT